ncbi:response regulator [Zestomonas carbonaria]|uniref:Transcriptional regulatory protein RcsB n=1 Tax=Zestomonas carbonaria TaxID=2762745 RepID=A0A7U7IBN0_9GAMM|nr:response regulator [Pseudomonas carbonaria]CAD5110091.1 Transcriptional regulatory protein RcsB [Pseudomonas carbonaria]
MERIRVVLADDHPVVLAGVREIVERDERFEVMGEARNSSELVNLCREVGPQLLVTDYSMPGDGTYGDGIKLIGYLLRNFPDTRILVFTMISNSLVLSSLYELGVFGVVLKSGGVNELHAALNAMLHRQPYSGPGVSSVLGAASGKDDLQTRISGLSLKEYEVLRHFVSGLPVCDVARVLNRSAKTVSAQKISAMRKLEVKSDQTLLAFCAQAKLFQ